VYNKGVQEVITILYKKQGEKFMKVELQISETYKEEKLIVQAPQETDKIQKVIEFAENLDQKETIKGAWKGGQTGANVGGTAGTGHF